MKITRGEVLIVISTLVEKIENGEIYDVSRVIPLLYASCEACDFSLSIEYHNGLFQKPITGGIDVEWSEPFLEEDKRGYTVSLASRVYATEHGDDVYFDSLGAVVGAALTLLKEVLEEKE